jgi:hypothetical protein
VLRCTENSKWKRQTSDVSSVLSFTIKKTFVNNLRNHPPYTITQGIPFFITLPQKVPCMVGTRGSSFVDNFIPLQRLSLAIFRSVVIQHSCEERLDDWRKRLWRRKRNISRERWVRVSFLWWTVPQQMLRTHRSLEAYCVTLWWRWIFFFRFSK